MFEAEIFTILLFATSEYFKIDFVTARLRAGFRLQRVGGGGAQVGEGSRGPPRPLVGPGQSPGRGLRGRSPRRKTNYSVLEWPGRLSLALFCKKNRSFQ